MKRWVCEARAARTARSRSAAASTAAQFLNLLQALTNFMQRQVVCKDRLLGVSELLRASLYGKALCQPDYLTTWSSDG